MCNRIPPVQSASCPKRTEMIRSRGSARAFSGVGSVGRQCQDWSAASLYPHMHASAALLILDNARWQALIRHGTKHKNNADFLPYSGWLLLYMITFSYYTIIPPWHCSATWLCFSLYLAYVMGLYYLTFMGTNLENRKKTDARVFNGHDAMNSSSRD